MWVASLQKNYKLRNIYQISGKETGGKEFILYICLKNDSDN